MIFGEPAGSNAKEVSLDELASMINAGEIAEVTIRSHRAEGRTRSSEMVEATVGSDAAKESIVENVARFNKANPASIIALSETPAGSGFGWIIIVQILSWLLPVIGFVVLIVFGVWAVRTLSGNKG